MFLLISPPFVPPVEQDEWLLRSMDVAFCLRRLGGVADSDARRATARMEALAAEGHFAAPRLEDIERSVESALAARPVAAASSSISGTSAILCAVPHCLTARRARLHG